MRKKGILALVLFVLLTITVGAAAQKSASLPDLNGHWSEPYVRELADCGAVSGFPDGTFGANRTVSAAEFVKIVADCRDAKITPQHSQHWAAGWMEGALQCGYYDWDEIPPTGENFNQPIARQLAVKIVMKAFAPDVRGSWEISSRITDWNSVGGRYYDAVLAAYASGVLDGRPDGSFCPNGSLTRGEACKIIVQAKKLTAGTAAEPNNPAEPEKQIAPAAAVSGPVSKNGWLQVNGTQLCNERGEAIILRGMSSHGLQWFPQYATETVMKSTAARGANVFRAAMYTAENGYLSNPTAMRKALDSTVDAAICADLYVIVDWHILSDGNPRQHQTEAAAFFDAVSKKYADVPNVIYEICNEPNGNVSWSGDVKPYAEAMVQVIRKNAPQSIILIGSPTWSQDVNQAADDPVRGSNLMYTCHFYAGTHGQSLRDKISYALKKGAPIFISEWGTSDASGDGGPYLEQTETWLKFLDQNRISWCCWSLADKSEASAALKPGCNPADGISDSELSASGAYVFRNFNR